MAPPFFWLRTVPLGIADDIRIKASWRTARQARRSVRESTLVEIAAPVKRREDPANNVRKFRYLSALKSPNPTDVR
jgi:hypothetical protein